jgi:uncharacterized protein YecE (DUF72 family)
MAQIRVGIAGWVYEPWRGNFYPAGLTQKYELAYASRRFNALEINGTFYSLQKPSTFQKWYEAASDDFVFALKSPEQITHRRRLKEPRQLLANFFASGLLCLKEKFGPILWQLPHNMKFDEERLKAFLELLPHDTKALARLAKEHDLKDEASVHLEPDAKRPVRHAVEFRHESFMTDRFVDLLKEHNVAVVIADADSKFPSTEDVTADWVYVRLHGERVGHESGYAPEEIGAWAKKIETWRKGKEPAGARRLGEKAPPAEDGRDVFVFFNNTQNKLLSPVNARQMVKELGLGMDDTDEQIMRDLGGEPPDGKKPPKKGPKTQKKPKKND